MGHVRGFEYFRCDPRLIVPDNLKSAVTKVCWCDPDINQSYAKLAEHHEVGVLPARPAKPKDKPKVETGVQIIQRWIVARLRNRRFYSLAELNKAIRELLDEVNHKPMQKLKKSRHELFEELDRPNAGKLPNDQYKYHEWLTCKVGFDYHIKVDKHYYSVPYQYYGKQTDIRVAELSTADRGETDSKGHMESWNGFKFHVDAADGQVPISRAFCKSIIGGDVLLLIAAY